MHTPDPTDPGEPVFGGKPRPADGTDGTGAAADRPSPLADALLSRPRTRILHELRDRGPMSAIGLARALGLPQSTVNEHVKKLHEQGLLEETEILRRRNAVERVVRPTDASQWMDGEDWEALPAAHKRRLVANTFAAFEHWLSRAIESTEGDFSVDSVWAASIYSLDPRGLAELVALHRRTLTEAAQITAAAAARRPQSAEAWIRVCQAQFLFEMPEET
jgi:DNA-binding transcriptional ArsR family regulator